MMNNNLTCIWHEAAQNFKNM